MSRFLDGLMVAVLLTAGCGKPAVQNTAASNAPPQETAVASPPAKNITIDSSTIQSSTVEATARQSEEIPRTSGTPPAPAGSPPATTPKTAAELVELANQHSRSGNIDAAVAALKEAVQLEPKNRRAVLGLSVVLQSLGIQRMQKGDSEQGYGTFIESARLMRALRAEGPLGAQERTFYANALYNEACALAMGGDPTKALESLRESLQEGFKDLSQINQDTDLAEVRKLPGFQALMEEHAAKASEAGNKPD